MVVMLQNDYKNQVVYRTNADYFASYEKLKEAQSNVVASFDQTEKGHIWFRLAETKTVFVLSPKGKLQIKWSDLKEKQVLLKIVRSLLVPEQGQKLKITPTSQQAYISYPPPTNFKLYWCEEKTEYVKKSDKRFRSESERKRALKHSKNLLLTNKYKQGYDAIMPHMVIDKLAFHDLEEDEVQMAVDMDDRCVFQHLKSGYEVVYSALLEYRRLMDETGLSKVKGFPKFRISRTPLPKGGPYPMFLPHGPIQEPKIPSLSEYLDTDEENPEVAKRYRLPVNVSKEKIKKLLNLREFVYFQICKILRHVEHGSPLLGSCEDCPL